MMARKVSLTVVVVAAASAGTWALLRPPLVRTAMVARHDVGERIQGVGTVEARVVVQIASKATAWIVSLAVDQGDHVTRGQVLARLDDAQLVADVHRAQAALLAARAQYADLLAGSRLEEITEAQENVARAQAQLDDLRAGPRPQEMRALRERLDAARATRLLAEKERSRNRQLLTSGYVTQQDTDRSEQAAATAAAQENEAAQALHLAREGTRKDLVAAAEAQVRASRSHLDFLAAGARPHQLAAARAQAEQAEAALVLARQRVAEARLVSPFDGYVVARDLEVGATVNPGTSILKLADARTLWVTVHVDEWESGRLAMGDAADIRLRSQPAKRLRGRVARVRRESDRVTEQLTVDVAFADRPARAILGEQVEVEIGPAPRKGVACLPLSALVRRPEGSGAVVVDGGRLSFRRATFGMVDARGWIEVLDGLGIGEVVVLAPGTLGTPSMEGARVRAIAAGPSDSP